MEIRHPSLTATARQVFLNCFMGVLACTMVGCATPSIYYWGNFEDGLHNRYITQDQAQADVYLFETIRTAEQQNLRVPPGAYADYGFLLFKRGDREGAIAYFEKEKRLFPESSAFMTKLIERVKQKDAETKEKGKPQGTGGGAQP